MRDDSAHCVRIRAQKVRKVRPLLDWVLRHVMMNVPGPCFPQVTTSPACGESWYLLYVSKQSYSGCSARVVTVSPGPLIRVEGQPVSIRCDVNDYGGPSEQDFDWEMSREVTGPKIRIISTFESGFSDSLFSRRVASGDISVVRLQDNEAELKIGEVKLTDAGFYLCRTPSTDPTTSGNYNAQVQLRVGLNSKPGFSQDLQFCTFCLVVLLSPRWL
ncbi:hypothetical protein CCH79_00013144 [Gambusia affinis]|uniref:Ig-like domain-containing protein n=1 Tax=Gambusia affinis TaxID=33528 RepID=A0A315W9B4_GAMAF|nr:hypothetical protein CCH79_00013144 [Gambusia affinis]